jgi:replicative DNA helicase
MTVRARPHSIEAEKSVLGSIFIKPATFDQVRATLEVDDFFLPVHREIFEAMLASSLRGVPLDPVIIWDALKAAGVYRMLDGGMAHLVALANETPTAENVGFYTRIVREKATLRRLIAACGDIADAALGNVAEFNSFVDQAEARIAKAIGRAP